MKRLIFALICFFAIQPRVFAQATWGNLSFGTSLDDIRNYLMKQGVELEKREASWNVRQGWDYVPAGYIVVLHFVPRLYFSASERLERIVLSFSDPNAATPANVAATSVREQLIGKYGAPASESAGCTAVDVEQPPPPAKPVQVDCRAIWKTPVQVVTLSWTNNGPGGRRLQLEIGYVALQDVF
jgi:hypothetical protein